ncbi:DMT family transporter [Streptomyces cinnamoneus]|uniref:DMT family transporter n=1 Tax=Streptomyces cinnamoneus TaxID=53446 RepID=UPI003795F2BC
MTLLDALALFAVAALWGASFLFIREATPVLGPVSLIEARVVLAGVALLVVILVLGRARELRHNLREFLILGLLNAAIPFTLIAAAELKLTASLASVINATTPLFALLVSAARARKRPSRRQSAGALLGILGVGVLVGLGPVEVDGMLVLAAVASMVAALFYALGGVYAKTRLSDVHPLLTATGQQLGGAVILFLPALALPPREAPGTGVVLGVLALALASTSLGYVLFYRLINNVGPTGAQTVTFLVPLFGLLWGTTFLGEDLGWSTLPGLALVLAAVFLVTDMPRRKPRSPEAVPVAPEPAPEASR